MFDGKVFFLDVEPTVHLLDKINETGFVRAQRFGAGLHLYAAKEATIEDLSEMLGQIGIDPRLARPTEPNLEDAFIQLMEPRP